GLIGRVEVALAAAGGKGRAKRGKNAKRENDPGHCAPSRVSRLLSGFCPPWHPVWAASSSSAPWGGPRPARGRRRRCGPCRELTPGGRGRPPRRVRGGCASDRGAGAFAPTC